MGRVALVSALLAAVVLAVAVQRGGRRVMPPPAARPVATTILTAAARRTLRGKPITLAQDSLRRRAEKMTLRVRNISCAGVAIGSGWAIDPHTLVTNRHVLAGAAVLEMDAWDGTAFEGDVAQAEEGRLVDIGIAAVPQRLPVVAKTGPRARPGDRVTAVGYPLGGQLTLAPGRVISYLDGRTLPPEIAFDGPVTELSTRIKHGNSGGPVLNGHGRVVGIIYAGQPGATEEDYMRLAYAIPLSSARTLLRTGGTQAVLPCEQ
jgi:S1-C subfamily serine protease